MFLPKQTLPLQQLPPHPPLRALRVTAEILQTVGLKSGRTRSHRGCTEQYSPKFKNSHLFIVSIEDVSAFFKAAHQSINRWKSKAHPP